MIIMISRLLHRYLSSCPRYSCWLEAKLFSNNHVQVKGTFLRLFEPAHLFSRTSRTISVSSSYNDVFIHATLLIAEKPTTAVYDGPLMGRASIV